MSSGERYNNVWDAIEDSPEQSANMRLRAELMRIAQEHVRGMALTQREAASQLGLTQPRLNDLLQGRIQKFSLDALVKLLSRAGKRVEIDVKVA